MQWKIVTVLLSGSDGPILLSVQDVAPPTGFEILSVPASVANPSETEDSAACACRILTKSVKVPMEL
jgi:hypothetical protein